jgi:iron complex outermembrane receptor protein
MGNFSHEHQCMMKLFLISTLILCSSLVFSQQKLSGVITDSMGITVPFVPMVLLTLPDSVIIKGTMTDETGKYFMDKLPAGHYMLKISAVGYQEKIMTDISIDSLSNVHSFNIQLNPSSHILADVSVSAIKRVVEIKNGNVIVNVEDSPLAQGNSVFDLLSKLPGVSIENNSIRIQGKEGVIVIMDGRLQAVSGAALLNLLKSTNADLVKSIEILKNPPVKYDASGTSGMINIISKKITTYGLTGTVFSSYSQGFYEQLMSGASLNYKVKKITFYSNISAEQGIYRTVEKFKKRFTSDSAITYLSTDFVVKGLERNINYKAGFDWQPSQVDVIGIKMDGNPGDYMVKAGGSNSVSGINNLGFDHLDSKNDVQDTWNTTSLNLNYDHKTDTLGSSFSLVTDYSGLTEDIADQNSNQFYDLNGVQVLPANNFRNDNKINSTIFSGRADYMKIISPSLSIESGLKMACTKTLNDYLFERYSANNNIYLKDTGLSNKFKYTEITYAGYFNYIRSVKKLNMQLGLRFEKTFLTVGSSPENFELHKEYFNVFPNFSFDYKKSDIHDFQLNLSRRIDRPYFNDLIPVRLFRDQYSFSQGNPYELPDYANRGELTYSYKSKFSTAIAYSYTERIIMEYVVQNDSTKITMENTKNMKSCNSMEYSVFYQKSLTKKWEVSINGSFAIMDYKGEIDGVNFHRTGTVSSANLSNTVLVGKNAKLELSGKYLGPNVYNVVRRKQNWMASVAVKMSLCKDQLDLTAGLDDIFYSFIWHTRVSFENQNWSYSQMNDTRRFRIALNYKFGKMKIEERLINQSNEEEKGRLKH